MADIFEDHPAVGEWRRELFDLIRATQLDWQILTKRPENIAKFLPSDWSSGWPNVWLGTSIEDERVVEGADYPRDIPAIVRFVSYQPALGPLAPALELRGIHWLICGGESGSGFRPNDLTWARDLCEGCREKNVVTSEIASAVR